jgi:hypothetical protein
MKNRLEIHPMKKTIEYPDVLNSTLKYYIIHLEFNNDEISKLSQVIRTHCVLLANALFSIL